MNAKNYDGLTPKEFYDSQEEQEELRDMQKEWTRQYKRWISNKEKYPSPDVPAYYRMDIPKKTKHLLRRK